jgi:RNA ligase
LQYSFPLIKTIHDVLPVIAGKREFIVGERDWFTVINYAVQTEDTFPPVKSNEDAILRECRGIIFDAEGQILSRPFHKFFNVGERAETQVSEIDVRNPHWRLEKVDGSMVRPLFSKENNGFRLATKMGITDVAMKAEVFLAQHPKYFKLFRFLHEAGETPLFEWIAPNNRIVIDYKEPNLILLAVRENISGLYMSFDVLMQLGGRFEIPVVPFYDPVSDLDAFLTTVREERGREGYVIRFASGHMLKVKATEYLLMHKSKDIVSSERKLIELILSEKIDDIKPTLFKEDLERVNAIETKVADGLLRLSDYILHTHLLYMGMDRKAFALLSQTPGSGISQFQRWATFKMMDGTLPLEIAKDYVSGYLGTDSKYGMLKSLVPQFGF